MQMDKMRWKKGGSAEPRFAVARLLQFSMGSLILFFSSTLLPGIAIGTAEYSARAQFFPGGQRYTSPATNNKLTAANQALAVCRTQHANDTGYCDIVEQSNQPVQTAADLKATRPSSPYPLYLWHIENKGSHVYLAGSIHLLKPGFFPLPRQFDDALAHADFLVLEVDAKKLSATELQQRTLKYGSLPVNQKLNTVLPAPTYKTLGRYLSEYGADITNLHALKPNLVTQQLALLALMGVGYNPEIGLEAYFRNRAASKPVLELESFDFQLNLLLNGDLPTQIEFTQEMLKQMPTFETTTAGLVAAWLYGDDQGFAEISAQQQGDSARLQAFSRALIEDRNQTMANTIRGYLNSGQSYFVLVGAAHLVGDEGIPNILNRAGYPTRRVSSDQSLTTQVTKPAQ